MRTARSRSDIHFFSGESFPGGELPRQLDSGVLLFICCCTSKVQFMLISPFLVILKALFNSLPPEDYVGGTLVLGGDGRYFNKEAAQVSYKMWNQHIHHSYMFIGTPDHFSCDGVDYH